MNNKPLIPSPFDNLVELKRHINDTWRCLCDNCVEKRKLDRKRQEILDKEWEEYHRKRNAPTL